MSWFNSLLGRSADTGSNSAPPPEVIAIFEKLCRYLDDENAQNDRQPEPLRSKMKGGADCDEIPGAIGDFGRTHQNPIPVNAPLGEMIYLSNLLSTSEQILFFHRLGSNNGLDIYETVSADAKDWDILILDCYHPRKSHRAPNGYRLASGKDRKYLFSGTNVYVNDFPTNLPRVVADCFKRFLGMSMASPDIRSALEQRRFIRSAEHSEIVDRIRARLAST